jgi:hypothetical protein
LVPALVGWRLLLGRHAPCVVACGQELRPGVE